MTAHGILGRATGPGLAAILLLGAAPALAAGPDWRDQIGTFNIGILSGENEADRLRRLDCWADVIGRALDLPVDLYPAADYAGVMQGLLAGQLHMAGLGASAYAGIVLQDPDAVEVLAVNAQEDGSLGYYAVLVVRADSDIHSIEDLEGRSLAWADPNSASGYLFPRGDMELAGIDPDTFFGSTGFSGGHEQGVIAVLNEQYDAAATWVSGQGDEAIGFSRGNLRRMVDNGLLDMADIRLVWWSEMIPNGPTVIRQDLPQEAKDILFELVTTIHETDPDCYRSVTGGEGGGFRVVESDFYDQTIALRRREIEQSR